MDARTEVDIANPGERRSRSSGRRQVDDAPSWREALGTSGLVQIAVLIALVWWLYTEQFYRLFVYWKNPDWSHGFLIPFFSLYLIGFKRRELVTGSHPGSIWGFVLILLSLVVYVWSILARIGYPQSLSIIAVIAGLVLALRGWRTLRLTAFPIAFLLLAIPPPDRLYRSLTQPLQQGAAFIAAFVLDAFPGAEVQREGINLAFYMPGGHEGAFTVAGACSGMRSLMAFVALGLATAYFTPRPAWQRLAMALLVIPVAIACNVARVILTGLAQMYRHADLAGGTPHTVLGLLMFALGLAIYVGILWILDHLVVDDPDAKLAVPSTDASPESDPPRQATS